MQQSEGHVEVNGGAALLELGSGFNSEYTGRENVYLNGSIMGLSKSECVRNKEVFINIKYITGGIIKL